MQNSYLASDQLLFTGISEGSETAFRSLFDKYKKELFAVSFKMTKSQIVAEEITQEIFISLWISRVHLSEIEDPAKYLYRILLNKVSAYLKKELNRQTIIRDAQNLSAVASQITQHTIDARESQRVINELVENLPDQQKKVYKLSRVHGCSNNEIASQLNISTHTVKSHLSKALLSIRNYLRDAAMVMFLFNSIK